MTERTKPCVRCGMTFRIGRPELAPKATTCCGVPGCTIIHGDYISRSGSLTVVWVDDAAQVETSRASCNLS